LLEGAQGPSQGDRLPWVTAEQWAQMQANAKQATLLSVWETARSAERWPEARGLAESLVHIARQSAEANPGDGATEHEYAEALERAGSSSLNQGLSGDSGAFGDAVMDLAQASRIRQMLADLDPNNVDKQRRLASTLARHGVALRSAGMNQDAADAMARAVAAYRRIIELAPHDQEATTGLTNVLSLLAWCRWHLGDLDGAVHAQEELVRVLSDLADQAPLDREIHSELARELTWLGCLRMLNGQPESAVEPLSRANATYADLATRIAPEDHEARLRLARSHTTLGAAHAQADQPDEALPHLDKAVTALRALAEQAPDDRETQNSLGSALAGLGQFHHKAGRPEQAADYIARSVRILQLLADLDPAERPTALITALNEWAKVLRDLGRTDEADEAAARATALADRHPDED
jgi:tetratricopeptide (TPR) repeat protein